MAVVLPHHSNSRLLTAGQIGTIPIRYLAVSDGLVAYYPLDPDSFRTVASSTSNFALDMSGNNNHLGVNTSSAAPVISINGQIGGSATFTGALTGGSYATAINLGLTKWSVSLWAKMTAGYTSSFNFLVAGGTSGSSRNFYIGTNVTTGFIFVGFTHGGTNVNLQSTVYAPTAGIWQHLVGTFDGANIKLYFNGVMDTPFAAAFTPDTSASLSVGSAFSNAFFTTGSLDDVRIYNRALDATEVQILYQAGLSGQRHSNLDIPEDAEMDAMFFSSAPIVTSYWWPLAH